MEAKKREWMQEMKAKKWHLKKVTNDSNKDIWEIFGLWPSLLCNEEICGPYLPQSRPSFLSTFTWSLSQSISSWTAHSTGTSRECWWAEAMWGSLWVCVFGVGGQRAMKFWGHLSSQYSKQLRSLADEGDWEEKDRNFTGRCQSGWRGLCGARAYG